MRLGVHAALGAPDQASFAIVARTNGATWLIPLFYAHGGRGPVGLEIGRVDHHGLLFTVLGGQAGHDPGEDGLVTLPLPAVVVRLMRTVFRRRVTPTQPIAIYKDNPA